MNLKVAIGSWEAPPTVGGPAHYIDEIVKRLSDFVEITLLVPQYASITQKNGLSVQKVGFINLPIVRVCMFSLKASALVKKIGVDLVHDNGVLGFSNHSPFIETWHHGTTGDKEFLSASAYYLSTYREWLTLRGLKKSDSIIAISQTAKDELINEYSIPSSKIYVAPHGVDVDFFKPLSSNKIYSYAKKDGEICLLYVGSLSARKNLESLIRALKELLTKRSDIYLLIVGAEPENGYIHEAVRSLNLTGHVTFLGNVSPQHLVELYNTADFVVLPSYKEGFGMTILEALACGKPVIMTPVGISDIVKRNNLGVVADGFNPSNLTNAIEIAIEGKFSNLRSFVQNNFSWDKTVQTILQIYKQTINHS
jgi:glycosyltransferase involved in cell wall biosynthesis